MNRGLARNLSCLFLKYGDAMLMSKGFSLISSNPNWRSTSLQDTRKKLLGIPSTTCSKAITFVAKTESFLEKEFLWKEVSGRKVELDEVIVPSLELESSSSEKSVLVMPTPTREEANDNDHETSDQVTTEPHRSTRA